MTSIHGICIPQKRGVDKEGGRYGHICDVLPQGVIRGEVSGARNPGGGAQRGRPRENFVYRHFISKVVVVQ